MKMLRNWVESWLRPIRKKTPHDESGFWFWNFAVKHEIQKRLFQRLEIHPQSGCQLRNETPDLMDFYVSLFFSGNPKRRGLSGVNRWQEWAPAVGYKAEKKLALDFSMEIHLEDRFFIIEIRFCFSCFNAKSEICISKFKSGFTSRKHPEL